MYTSTKIKSLLRVILIVVVVVTDKTLGNSTSSTTQQTSVVDIPTSTISATPTQTALPSSTILMSTASVPTENTTIVSTVSPSSGLNLKQKLLFVLLGVLCGCVLVVVVITFVMCKYGKRDNQSTVTPPSTDDSDEPNEHPPRSVWSDSSHKNKK